MVCEEDKKNLLGFTTEREMLNRCLRTSGPCQDGLVALGLQVAR